MPWFEKLSNGVKFFLGVVMIYVIVAFLNRNLALTGLEDTGKMFLRLIPVLMLVLVIMFVINRFVHTDRVRKHFGEESGWKGWLWSVITGILISGPPYVLFPLLEDMKKKGTKSSLIAVFLYNRNVKIPFFPVMVYYFGWVFTVIISFYIIFFSFLSGWLIQWLHKKGRCD